MRLRYSYGAQGGIYGAQSSQCGYMLIEALVYIGVVFVVLGVGYMAADRYIEGSVAMQRSAEDIASALHAGERWRADVRSASSLSVVQEAEGAQLLNLQGPRGEIRYRFDGGAVSRRAGEGPWSPVLLHVRSSAMLPDHRQQVTAWRWEIEMQKRSKGSRVTPLFTFLAAARDSK